MQLANIDIFDINELNIGIKELRKRKRTYEYRLTKGNMTKKKYIFLNRKIDQLKKSIFFINIWIDNITKEI